MNNYRGYVEAETSYMDRVARNGSELQYVPRQYITEEMCSLALETDPEALMYIPREILTPEMCMHAVTDRWSVISHVPVEYVTDEMRVAALTERHGSLSNLYRYVLGV